MPEDRLQWSLQLCAASQHRVRGEPTGTLRTGRDVALQKVRCAVGVLHWQLVSARDRPVGHTVCQEGTRELARLNIGRRIPAVTQWLSTARCSTLLLSTQDCVLWHWIGSASASTKLPDSALLLARGFTVYGPGSFTTETLVASRT